MNVKVHKDYEQIDRENVKIFNKFKMRNSMDDMYRCVICDRCKENIVKYCKKNAR